MNQASKYEDLLQSGQKMMVWIIPLVVVAMEIGRRLASTRLDAVTIEMIELGIVAVIVTLFMILGYFLLRSPALTGQMKSDLGTSQRGLFLTLIFVLVIYILDLQIGMQNLTDSAGEMLATYFLSN